MTGKESARQEAMTLFQQSPNRAHEKGYVLLVFTLFAALLVVGVYRILPKVVFEGQRTKEEELIFRAKQYRRGIQLFVRKFGRYPNSLEELENTNQIRFIRQLYPDPMTKESEWRLIHIGPDGSFYDSANLVNPAASSSSSSSSQGSKSTDPFTPGDRPPATIPNAGQGGNANQPRASGSIAGQSGQTGRTFGGGGIAGVASKNEGEGIKVINQYTHYNEWEFVYDYRTDPFGLAAVNRASGVPQSPGGPGGNPGQPQGERPDTGLSRPQTPGRNPLTGLPIGTPTPTTPPGTVPPPIPGGPRLP